MQLTTIATVLMFASGLVMTAVSIIEILALRRTRKWAADLIDNMPDLCVSTLFRVLENPENKKKLQEMILDQQFFEAVSQQVFQSLKQGVYSILGADNKLINKVGKEMAKEQMGPLGQILEMLPDNKWGKMLKENPGLLLRIGQQFLGVQQQHEGTPV